MKLKLNLNVYSPSDDTDLVVSCLDEWFDNEKWPEKRNKDHYWILDMGCGPGTLGLYFLKELKHRNQDIYKKSRLLAIDRNPEALSIVEHNAVLNGMGEKLFPIKSDLFQSLSAKGARENQAPLLQSEPATCEAL